jgi:hypothetical protein
LLWSWMKGWMHHASALILCNDEYWRVPSAIATRIFVLELGSYILLVPLLEGLHVV